MANRNLNSDQFMSHEQHLSGLENEHGVEFTPMGLKHAEGVIPTSNVEVTGWEGPSIFKDPDRHPSSSISLYIPSEDPNVHSTLNLFSSASDPDYSPSGVETVEHHGYPRVAAGDPVGEGGDLEYRSRYNWHEDVPSAVRHLNESAQQRKVHLDKGSIPAATTTGESMGDTYFSDNNGRWGELGESTWFSDSKHPDTMQQEGLIPPSTMKYTRIHHTKGDAVPYRIDTGTRERIPKEDQ